MQKENGIEKDNNGYMNYLENNNQLAISEGNTKIPYVAQAKRRRQKSFGFSQILLPTVNPCSGISSINQHLYSGQKAKTSFQIVTIICHLDG